MMIRESSAADQPELLSLLQKNTDLPMGELERFLERGQRLVALQDGVLRGFATLTPGRPGTYSFGVHVDPAVRRQGIGDNLLSQLLSTLPVDAQHVSYRCPATDEATQGFLGARGFQPWFSNELMHYFGPAFPYPELTARPYQDSDYEPWINLINEGFYPMRKALDIQPYQHYSAEEINNPATRQKMQNSGNDDDLLFYDGDQLVGMAELNESEIDTVTVVSQLRQQGYGRKIVAFCTNRLLARGIDPVTLHVVSSNSAARKLYEGMGFRFVERHDMLRLKLGQE